MRRRPQQRSKSPPSRLLSACVLLLFAFLVLEFCFIHQHGPAHHEGVGTKRDDPSTMVPGLLPPKDGHAQYSAAIPRAPSVPDSMKGLKGLEGRRVPGHDRTKIDEHRQQRTAFRAGEAIDNGSGVGAQLPPRPPLGLDWQTGGGDEPGRPLGEDEGYGEMRVAVLIPYSGPGLPIWFDAFTDLAAANKDLIDWIIFCAEVRGRATRVLQKGSKLFRMYFSLMGRSHRQ